MLVVALTGNIATGKSLVSQYFAELGAKIINADRIAADIREQKPVKESIINHFGEVILHHGEISRPALREIIFNKPNEKKWLEQLLHPLIRQEMEKQISSAKSDYVIVEIPLHFNRKDYPYIDKVVVVNADENKQIKRIMSRDSCSENEARAAIKNQPDLETRLSIADDIIENNGDYSNLKQQVIKIDRKYKSI